MNILAVNQLTTLWNFLLESSLHYGLNAVLAIFTLAVGWWLSSRFANALDRVMIRASLDATLRPVLRSVLLWLVRLITLVAVLGQFGVQTASIVAILGAAGLAIGLALQGTLQNIAAGMMLLFLRPFQVGEYISNGSIEGTVDEIGLFATKLTKADGICLFVPNNQLWNSALTNFSRNNTRRIDMPVGINYKDNPAAAIQALQKLLLADERILATPAPLVVVTDHADSAVMLNMRAWTTTSEYWAVRWSLAQNLQAALASVNCSIPFPTRELLITQAAEASTAA
ncbi:mechanosensitive ion channel family protein [Collimonas pratensis]|uniref:Small-conductance mechanosensitive channel n=1 Tax=Collimonas pratensis TaxID=279113 RepID=A0A127QD94_9BURK|nr:mechanosensitive ion channel domain-containing protein [Collimonas pratensis]AMP07592.1 mechanosensitive ion channel family protein [Collimonas pratensis]AMP17327.1 mechanosensitive ion channel family protein [Collimonas pratensis]NKI71312.1 mechanosensitive ion channel [Collimonas pratensis]